MLSISKGKRPHQRPTPSRQGNFGLTREENAMEYATLDQLRDNLAAVELKFTQDELKQLDEVSALPPEYPGWVLPFQGADRLKPVDRWERFREASKPH
jgi:hypothetical protein